MNEITEEDMELKIEESNIEISPAIKELAEGNKIVHTGNRASPGCGSVLGLKVALQVADKCVLVGSYGCASLLNLKVPAIYSPDAIALARGIEKSARKSIVIVYSGDGSLEMHKESLFAAARRNENVLCICYNNQGNCNMHGSPKQRFIARSVLPYNPAYAATASLSHMDDYIRKLRKAVPMHGFRFIELLCPCPAFWGFDASNTVEVARLAVESGFWPLYEAENKTVTINTAGKLQLEKFLEAQNRYKNFPEEKILKMKETAEKNLIEIKNLSK